MAKRKKKRQPADVNVGPFSDIAFLLIIFFILTATFLKLAGNKLDIPSAESSPTAKTDEQPTITLVGNRITWGQSMREIELEELRSRLFNMNLPEKPESKRIVVINSAPDVPYQRYYEVMMSVNDAGGVLGLIAEEGQKAVED